MTRRRNSASGRVKATTTKEPSVCDDHQEEEKTSMPPPRSTSSDPPVHQTNNDHQDETNESSSSISSIPLTSCFRGTLTTYTTETHQLIPLAEIRLYQTQTTSQLCTTCWSDQEQESKMSEDEKVKASSWRGWNSAHPRPVESSTQSNTTSADSSSHKSKSKSKARKKSASASPSSTSTSTASSSSSTAFASHHLCIFGEMDVNELTASPALIEAPTYWCQSSGFELTSLPSSPSPNDKMDERSLGNHLYIHFLQKLLSTRRVALVHFGGDSNECGLLFPISFNIGCIKLVSFTAAVGENSPLVQQISLLFQSHLGHHSQVCASAPFLLPIFQQEQFAIPTSVPLLLSTPSKPVSSATPPRSSRHTRTTNPSPPTPAISAAVTPAGRRGGFGSKAYHQGSGDEYDSSRRQNTTTMSTAALRSSPPQSKKRSRAVESEGVEEDIFATTTSQVKITAPSSVTIPSGPNLFGTNGVEVLQSYPNMIGLLPPPCTASHEQKLDPFEIYQVLIGPSTSVQMEAEDVEMKDPMEKSKQVDPNDDVAPMDIEIDETQTSVEAPNPPPAAAAPPLLIPPTLTEILMTVEKEYHTYLTKSEFEPQHMYDFFHHLALRVNQVWTNEHAAWLQDKQPELLINIPNQPSPVPLHLESDVSSLVFLARHLLRLLKKSFSAKDYLEMKDKSGKILPGKDKVSQEKLKMRFLTLQLHLLLLYAFPTILPVDGPNPALQSLQTEATNLLKKLPISVARPDFINNILLLEDYKPPASSVLIWKYQDSVQFLFEQCRDFDCPEGKNRPYKFLLDWRHACLVGGDGSTSAANTTFTQQQHTITSQSTYQTASKSQSSRSQLPSVAARSNTTTSSQPQLVVAGEPSEAPANGTAAAATVTNPEPTQNGFLRFLHKKTLAEKVEVAQATTTTGPTASIAAATTISSLNQPTLIRTQTTSVAATNRPSALPQPGLVQSSLVLPRGRLCSSMSSRVRLIQVTAINKIPSRKAKEAKTTAATTSNIAQPPASKPPQPSRRPGSGRGKKRRSGGSGSSKKKRPGVKTTPLATTAAAAHATSLLLSPPRSNGHEIVIEETPAKPDRQPSASPQVNSTDHPKNLDAKRVFAADERTGLSMVAEGKPSQEEDGEAGHESDSPRPKKKTRRALNFDSPPPVINNTKTFELTSPIPISFTSPIRATPTSNHPLLDSGSSYVLHGTPSSCTSVTPSRSPGLISAPKTGDSNPRRSTRSQPPPISGPNSDEQSRVLDGHARSMKKEKVAAIKEKPEKKSSKKGRN